VISEELSVGMRGGCIQGLAGARPSRTGLAPRLAFGAIGSIVLFMMDTRAKALWNWLLLWKHSTCADEAVNGEMEAYELLGVKGDQNLPVSTVFIER
jgi:hypothetical protein